MPVNDHSPYPPRISPVQRGIADGAVPVQVGVVSQPDSRRMPLFENLGTLHHAITTTSEQAQQYFDQGLRLVMSSTMKRPFMRLKKLHFSTPRLPWPILW